MKKTFLLFFLPIVLIACSGRGKNPETNMSVKKADLPEIFYSNNPTYLQFTMYNYSSPEDRQTLYRAHWDDNTFYGKNKESQITIHNECNVKQYDAKTGLELRIDRNVEQKKGDIRKKLAESGFDFKIEPTLPIEIYSPTFDDCNRIPYCYFDEMQVTWNPNPDHDSKMFIVSEWNGSLVKGGAVSKVVHHADYVPDNGIAVLDTALFSGIPEYALVSMYFIRSELFKVKVADSMVDVDQYDWSNFDMNLLKEIEEQEYYLANGYIARFLMVLVRNLD